MPNRSDLEELNRGATARRQDLLQRLGLPEAELIAWCAGEAPHMLGAFTESLRQKGIRLAADDGEDAQALTSSLVASICAAFDTGFEVGAALALEKVGR